MHLKFPQHFALCSEAMLFAKLSKNSILHRNRKLYNILFVCVWLAILLRILDILEVIS